ncbi:uncharacterized protein LOC122235810 isoform X2 [Panthera tigris]|uniref:uncharacterized protein LOC122235810 isoform X2 n=1 Tax=Panthera tigris TaxID=9694 RepID=UPI001C6FB6C1|nr:uncharacterized protein LOC122235810 isoform X2 [Panthera tigris]
MCADWVTLPWRMDSRESAQGSPLASLPSKGLPQFPLSAGRGEGRACEKDAGPEGLRAADWNEEGEAAAQSFGRARGFPRTASGSERRDPARTGSLREENGTRRPRFLSCRAGTSLDFSWFCPGYCGYHGKRGIVPILEKPTFW